MVHIGHRRAGDPGAHGQRNRVASRRRPRRRGRPAAVLASLATAALSLSAIPADAAVTGGQSIEVFTGSNLISLTGYPVNTQVKIEVLRKGFVIGSAVKTTDADGAIEMNHIGAEANDCFDGQSSPDVMPGDTMRTTVLPHNPVNPNVDTSVVRGVWIDDIDYLATTIRVSGRVTLRGPAKVVPNTDVLELRINKDTVWDVNDRPNRRDRREDIGGSVNPNGTWTHLIHASAQDVAEAQAGSETFLEWSAGGAGAEEEAFPPELTVAEFGAGEALPGCPPLQQGPSAPQLPRALDSGKKGDHITNRSANLSFGGVVNTPGANAAVRLLVNGQQKATGTAGANGVYRFTGITLAPRVRAYALKVVAQGDGGGGAPFTGDTRMVKVDTSVPAVALRRARPDPLHLTGPERMQVVYRVSEAARLKAVVQKRLGTSARTVNRLAVRNTRRAGLVEYFWNGKNEIRRDVRPGRYQMVLTVSDAAGNQTAHRLRFRVVR